MNTTARLHARRQQQLDARVGARWPQQLAAQIGARRPRQLRLNAAASTVCRLARRLLILATRGSEQRSTACHLGLQCSTARKPTARLGARRPQKLAWRRLSLALNDLDGSALGIELGGSTLRAAHNRLHLARRSMASAALRSARRLMASTARLSALHSTARRSAPCSVASAAQCSARRPSARRSMASW